MDIKAYLKERPLLFDGAMGTYLAQKTGGAPAQCELYNLSHPDLISGIHREYLAAGARAIKTNTFGANLPALGGDGALLRDVVQMGWRLACDAAMGYADVWPFADIGPVPPETEDPAAAYCQVADLFLAEGADRFLFETHSTAQGVPEAAAHIRAACPGAYIILSLAVAPDGFTRDGLDGRALYAQMKATGLFDAVGFNCVSGAHHLLQLVKTLDHTGAALSVMPNAGYPRVIGSRTFFKSDPAYFGEKLAELAQAGAAILGGCCGTTPEHIAQAARALGDRPPVSAAAPSAPAEAQAKPASLNRLKAKLDAGLMPVAVELDPPAGDDLTKFMAGAWTLKGAGVDAITLADCPIARARMDSSIVACKLRRELNIDPLPHMTCRDRNMNAIKALLLGLSTEDVHNVLVITGDPVPTAERDEVKSVFNFNSRKLAKYISTLNETEFSTPFQICGALNVNANKFDLQLSLAREKVKNGVSVFFTQPVLSRRAVENLKKAHETLNAKIMGGIMPVVSYRNATFMNSEIPGIRVDDEIIAMYEGKTKEECRAMAVDLSVKIAREIAPYIDGYYLMTPFSRVDIICDILKEIKKE